MLLQCGHVLSFVVTNARLVALPSLAVAYLVVNVQILQIIVSIMLIVIQGRVIIRYALVLLVLRGGSLRVRTRLADHALLIQIINISNHCLFLVVLRCPGC